MLRDGAVMESLLSRGRGSVNEAVSGLEQSSFERARLPEIEIAISGQLTDHVGSVQDTAYIKRVHLLHSSALHHLRPCLMMQTSGRSLLLLGALDLIAH